MRRILTFHIIAAIILSLYGLDGLEHSKPMNFVLWLLLVPYLFLIIGMAHKRVWCVRLSVIPAILVFAVTASFVLYNFYLFLIDHELYQDSPATIFVVGLVAVTVTLPSLLALSVYWKKRKELFFQHT